MTLEALCVDAANPELADGVDHTPEERVMRCNGLPVQNPFAVHAGVLLGVAQEPAGFYRFLNPSQVKVVHDRRTYFEHRLLWRAWK